MQDRSTSFSIKDWADDDKPREKLVLKGHTALSDAELVVCYVKSKLSNSKNQALYFCNQK